MEVSKGEKVGGVTVTVVLDSAEDVGAFLTVWRLVSRVRAGMRRVAALEQADRDRRGAVVDD